jgi:hypothetical protein
MYWNRLAGTVRAEWQIEIDHRLESGTTPVLIAGAPTALLPQATTLLAYQTLAAARRDITTPLVVAGGSDNGWLGLLLPSLPTGPSALAAAPTFLYAGADAATYLATLGLLPALAEPGPAPRGLTDDLTALFAPRLQPGAPTAWEALPFLEVGDPPSAALAVDGRAGRHSPTDPLSGQTAAALPGPQTDPLVDWVAWGVMVLAFCLVLSALLI